MVKVLTIIQRNQIIDELKKKKNQFTSLGKLKTIIGRYCNTDINSNKSPITKVETKINYDITDLISRSTHVYCITDWCWHFIHHIETD